MTTYLSRLSFSGLKGPAKIYEFNKDLVLILGENGTGKTSILQAIHLLVRGKVFRSTGMSSVGNGKDIIKLANPGEKEISIQGSGLMGLSSLGSGEGRAPPLRSLLLRIFILIRGESKSSRVC